MNGDDHKFESFLREFAPRPPRPLPTADLERRFWPKLAAAAALILAVGAGSLWIGMRHIHTSNKNHQRPMESDRGAAMAQRPPMSTLALTQAALEGDPEFDKELDSRARRDLPGFNHKESMLRVLAKE